MPGLREREAAEPGRRQQRLSELPGLAHLSHSWGAGHLPELLHAFHTCSLKPSPVLREDTVTSPLPRCSSGGRGGVGGPACALTLCRVAGSLQPSPATWSRSLCLSGQPGPQGCCSRSGCSSHSEERGLSPTGRLCPQPAACPGNTRKRTQPALGLSRGAALSRRASCSPGLFSCSYTKVNSDDLFK